MTRAPPSLDFDIHVDQDCVTPPMPEENHAQGPEVLVNGIADHHEGDSIPVNNPTGGPGSDSHMDGISIHEDPDETVHADSEAPSRPQSSASHSHRGAEDDVFSDRSPRSSIHSADEHCEEDNLENMTEKGGKTPDVRSRVTSGVSAISDLSGYENEDFLPTSRNNRPAFRSPSSIRAMQMSSPTPSVYSNTSSRQAKRHNGLSTSRVGSPTASAQYSNRGRSTPSRFRRPEPAPLVLLHVTLLPPRWVYGDVVNHFEGKKIQPLAFSGEGVKNLRGAWRQLQDRLGDTEMERGILLPHPQNDYEVLEERLLEALELPLRRRARILECGHYLGPSNAMSLHDDIEDEYDDVSADEASEAGAKKEKKHWCKSCKGDIRYSELGSERVFRMKVYASNGLMSAGAWEACWREMERVDIEVEPIINPTAQQDLAKLAALFEQDQRKQFDLHTEEGQRLQFEEEQRQRLEAERRQKFEEERQSLEAQRRDFEEQRQQLDEQRKSIESEQRQHLEDARRQELEEEHRLLEQQRQQLEEARQQFEEERRQRLEEEELRRMQREEDELKEIPSPRAMSRASFADDDLASPAAETTASVDIDGRPSDPERLREIYGNQSRASFGPDGEQELEDVPEPQDSAHQQDAYTSPSPPSPSEQAYQKQEDRRRSLDNASLPELIGETIRVAVQDPKNVAIVVLIALLALLAGQFSKPAERGVELYKPPQQQSSYQHHQLGAGEPVGQVVVNTPPAVHYVETTSPSSQLVETIYKTVTESATSTVTEASSDPLPVETIYKTVTQSPVEETPSYAVETICSTVTAASVEQSAQSTSEACTDIEATEVASELTPNSADPSVDLIPLPLCLLDGGEGVSNSSLSLVTGVGFDDFIPSPSPELAIETEPRSNVATLKTISEEVEIDTDVVHVNMSNLHSICLWDEREPIFNAAPLGYGAKGNSNTIISFFKAIIIKPDEALVAIFNFFKSFIIKPEETSAVVALGEERPLKKKALRTSPNTSFTTATPQTTSVPMVTTTREKRIVRVRETVTETVLVTATRTRSALEMKMTSRRITPEDDDALSEESDGMFENEDEVLHETLIETVKITSTVEVDWPETTCDAFQSKNPAFGALANYRMLLGGGEAN